MWSRVRLLIMSLFVPSHMTKVAGVGPRMAVHVASGIGKGCCFNPGTHTCPKQSQWSGAPFCPSHLLPFGGQNGANRTGQRRVTKVAGVGPRMAVHVASGIGKGCCFNPGTHTCPKQSQWSGAPFCPSHLLPLEAKMEQIKQARGE